MRVVIYVEGTSDKAALNTLLAPLIEQKQGDGIAIDFFEAPEGDKKVSVLTKVPKKAVNIIINNPNAIVVAMPDLYPKNKAFPHETVAELIAGIQKNFNNALQAKGVMAHARMRDRFKVFCFKYDMESLVLAAEQELKAYLGTTSFKTKWRVPVEDQDHNLPPKKIVENLFEQHGKYYKSVIDAPILLRTSRYQDLEDRCKQCFKPFVKFLTDL